jgi:hypothetical protein
LQGIVGHWLTVAIGIDDRRLRRAEEKRTHVRARL